MTETIAPAPLDPSEFASTAIPEPIPFAHALFDRMYEHLPVHAPLDAALEPFTARIDRLQTLVAGHAEARALVREVSNLCADIAVTEYGRGIEFGVAAEQLRQTLRGSFRDSLSAAMKRPEDTPAEPAEP